MFFKKKEAEKDVRIIAKEEPVEQPEVEDEWIWVEGYKGTDKDMKCRDFQYELNTHFVCDNDIELCRSGFHFCTRLGDVFTYYRLNMNKSNKFFKVKGLVKKSDYDNSNQTTFSIHTGFAVKDSKLSAKEIVFLEELTFNDLKEYILNYYPLIETEEDYQNCDDYDEFAKNKFLSEMKNLGFSEMYSYYKYNDCEDHRDLNIFLQRAKAYQAEEVGKDVMIYLLERIK